AATSNSKNLKRGAVSDGICGRVLRPRRRFRFRFMRLVDLATRGPSTEDILLGLVSRCDASVRHGRQGRPYSLREIRCAIGHPRRLIDQGASPEFVKRQRGVDAARVIEVAIDKAVE